MKHLIASLILLITLGAGMKAQTGRIAMPIEIGISQRLGKPFTATEVTTLTQTLSDGTKIARTAEDRIARDSEGRTYKEQHLPWTQDSKNPVYYVNIYDAAAKKRTYLDPQRHVAMQGPIEPIYQRDYRPKDDPPIRASRKDETVKTENLGSQDIEGARCWGRRTTRVVPPGVFGNDQAITIIDEFWYSDELGLDLVRRHSDPRSGEQISELRDLQRTEPAPEMFKVPPDYTIQPLPTRATR